MTPCSLIYCSSILRNQLFNFTSFCPEHTCIIFFLFVMLVPTTRLYGVIPLNIIITLQLVSFIPSSHDCFSRHDFDKQRNHYEITIPRLLVTGQYTASGRILLLPISGNGDFNFTVGN